MDSMSLHPPDFVHCLRGHDSFVFFFLKPQNCYFYGRFSCSSKNLYVSSSVPPVLSCSSLILADLIHFRIKPFHDTITSPGDLIYGDRVHNYIHFPKKSFNH